MFEVIMLFAFLYAATCQLFPEEPSATKSPSKKRYKSRESKNDIFRLSSKNHRATQKKSSKTKSRSHSYADAA